MAGTTLKVDHTRIHDTAVELEAQRKIIELRLTELETTMTQLAGDGLVAEHLSPVVLAQAGAMKKNLRNAIDALEQYEKFLHGASDAYKDVDSELAQKLGGGGGAVNLDVDVDSLEDLKTHLRSALRALRAGRNAGNTLSASVLGHHEVVDAMADFDSDWRKRRGRLIESVDSLVSGYSTIVESFEKTDSGLHSNLANG